jgi:hypothetical protein
MTAIICQFIVYVDPGLRFAGFPLTPGRAPASGIAVSPDPTFSRRCGESTPAGSTGGGPFNVGHAD